MRAAFKLLGIDPAKRVEINPAELHKGDRAHTFGNTEATRRELGWNPRTSFEEMVERLVEYELGEIETAGG